MAFSGTTICLNGHILSKNRKNFSQYCPQCGKETFSVCTQCGAPIRGLETYEGIVFAYDRPYEKPYYCHQCGAPYPWTTKLFDNVVEILSIDAELNDSTKRVVLDALPGLLVEDHITTPISVSKFQKVLSSAGKSTRGLLRQLLSTVVCEYAKNILFS